MLFFYRSFHLEVLSQEVPSTAGGWDASSCSLKPD
jgi:hypothetical protein